MTWVPHLPSAPPPRPDVDFHRLHKSAVTNHVTTPKELAQFRSEGDFRGQQPSPSRTPPSIIPSDVIPGFAYGRPGRPSTPIRSVLSNDFGNEFEEALDERYQRIEDHRAAVDGKLRFKGTKAQKLMDDVKSQRRKDAEHPPDPMALWKMSKFQKTVTKLQVEAPLVRDREGRLQRCRSLAQRCSSPSMRCPSPSLPPVVRSPSPAIRTSASLPQLPRCSSPRCSSPVKETVCDSQGENLCDFMRTHGSLSLTQEALQHTQGRAFFGDQDDIREGFQCTKGTACFGKQDDCEPETDSECSGTPWTPTADLCLDDSVENRSGFESDATLPADGESPTSPIITDTTLVTILFTVRIAAKEELHLAVRALQGSIRSKFSDSMVKLGEWVVEQPRQALREKRQRYAAWGQKALDTQLGPVARPGPRPPVFSRVSCSLTVKHTSLVELKSIAVALVDCIRGSLPEDMLQVRRVVPAGLWGSPPASPPTRPPKRDGLGRPMPPPR